MIEPKQIDETKIAVVGCGYWGRNLVRNFHEIGALAAVCDVDEGRAAEQAERFEIPARPFSDILADDGVDGVVISAPAEQHALLVEEALLKGKHVFVEKPLALRTSDAERLYSLSHERERVLMVGHLLQYHPAFERLKLLCSTKELGRLQYIYSNRLNLGKFRTEENALWSFAPHDISMILSIMGGKPESVSAVGHSYLNHNVADVTTTHLTFAGGQAAHVHVSWLHPFKEQRLVVIGDRGMAVFDDTRPWPEKLCMYPHRVDWSNGVPEPSRAEGKAIQLEEAEPLRLECEHFLHCIRSNEIPRTDAREGLNVLRVLDAAQRSMETGRVVRFDSNGR